MSGQAAICLIEDDPFIGESLCDRLQLEGFSIDWHETAPTALAALRQRRYDLVISDIRLGRDSGEQLFYTVKAENRVLPPFLFITAYGSIEKAVTLLKLGAVDYIIKPFDIDELILKISALTDDARTLTPLDQEPKLGMSLAMRRIEATLPLLAARNASVLITGESGVGKEHVARLLHRHRANADQSPFVAINCAALSESLLEAELFGYEKGAFTGALRTKPGVFEQADGGTLFLDEVGDMPPPMQAKLLRVIQDRCLVRVGGEREIKVEVRLVCATNRDLKAMVGEGTFREDLYYRINVIHLHLPPLRDRTDDIPWFAQQFLNEYFALHTDEPAKQFDHSALHALIEHPWPGNVRELKHCIERACILSQQQTLTATSLLEMEGDPTRETSDLSEKLGERMALAEREFIQQTLISHDWHIIESAAALGISRKNLWEKMKKFDLHAPQDD
jgi:DNA-binding NtrC family response regulator